MRVSNARLFGATMRSLNGPVAPFKSDKAHNKGPVTFDRNFPVHRRVKAWERDREDKESWFKRKHAHHHAKQKKREPQRDEKPEFSRSQALRKTISQLKLNPLVEYLYGMNPVLAALKAKQRESFGTLYLHNPKSTPKLAEILALARELELPVKSEYGKHDLNLMTKNGVHNGIVVETKPIEVEQLRCLLAAEVGKLTVMKEHVGTTESSVSSTAAERYPLVLYIDEISDPHNMGAIIRSAYFLGVDCVVVSERNCAPLSPVVSKTSSGALEFLPIYSSQKPLRFFEESRSNGWTIISSVALTSGSQFGSKTIDADALKEQLQNGPCMLVVGSEGQGIRTSLLQRSDFLVSLKSSRADLDDSVDSLNASVATALLLSKFYM
ncbi:hypothetical protein KL949_005045 [Ogataea haglerorum]|uniref:uncharacterized protein n=1 Tax=Ogataea haglerorum TaxID=1937702 RepID=UPI001C8A4725|nr:uncharacterized protein KL911_005160 [Ogataea haglerorum]KAG7692211.1 hypothetical protein KL951_005120 [Ogataea haglerorum]KAG7693776.1 hypothetical protein KL915_004066 [Ogataea haglerorum]KAG7702812.1 hypothetical protein KL950_005081 [Ogataea haglerorum]KAG7713386.1 hypothetical protein KL913_005007 [Ogataea haglerorum]KAG7713882.1 hypothetical protein KL949_005045 [Ogataea haglerorum]